ncbi:MAG: AAA family ATPase [Pseudonocardiaceae bacterium]
MAAPKPGRKPARKPARKRPSPPPPPPTIIPPAPPNGTPPPIPSPRPAGDLPPTLGSMEMREREWLWPGYLPVGVVTVVTGPQGVGKTALLGAAACESTAVSVLSGDGGTGCSRVLWYSAEDDPRSMLHPRLLAAGVRLERIHCPDYDVEGRLVRRTQLPVDAQSIGDLAHRCAASLVVFDPLTSFLGSGMSPNDPLQVRAVMDSLSTMAAAQNLCVLATLHPRKGRAGSPLEWVSGSASWTQAARQVILLDRHPDRPGEYLLSVIKRCSAKPARPWRYMLALETGSPVIRLLDQCDIDAQELSEMGDLGELEERGDALAWLAAQLAEERETGLLYRLWQGQGYGRALWWRARRKLGVQVTRRGTRTDQQTYLYIPPPS